MEVIVAKTKSQKSLTKWTKQDWDYLSKADKDKPASERGRYLPKSIRSKMTGSEKAAENRKKRTGGGVGSRVAYSDRIKRQVRNA